MSKLSIWVKRAFGTSWLKGMVSVAAITLIVVRHIWPGLDIGIATIKSVNWIRTTLKIDATTISLLIIATLPWSASFIKRVRFPGGRLKQVRGTTWFKLMVSVAAISFILIHLIWPSLKIDTVAVGLLIVAALPWLTSLIESAKFPGGWEIKFRDIQAAGDKVTSGSPATTAGATLPTPSFLSIATQDST